MLPSSPTPIACPHDLRPGTVVCLHCRQVAREAASVRLRAKLTRIGVGAAALAVLSAAAIAGVAALRGDGRTGGDPAPAAAIHAVQAHATIAPPDTLAATRPSSTPALAPSAAAPSVERGRETAVAHAAAAPAAALQRLAPIVPEGRTLLPAGMHVVRTGTTVMVHFDTEFARTRRPEKFERTVRATLPAVYGTAAESLLAALPAGAIARAGDLLTDLPARGLHLPLGAGRTLALWPETRPGRDGPLVVRYRAVVTR